MKKKLNLSVLALSSLMLLGTLSSCGGGARTADFIVPEAFTSEAITIEFWSQQGDALQGITAQAITRLQAKYPNITVEHKSKSNYDLLRDDIATNIPVGGNPDIAYCYPDHVALYNDANVVVPLDDLLNDNQFGYTKEQQDDFVESFMAEGRVFGDGKLYTMPFVKSTEVLFYNKTFFAEHNLTMPENPTWEQIWDLAAQIKTIDNNSFPLGYDSESNWFITMAEQLGHGYTSVDKNGVGSFDFDNPGMRAFVTDLKAKYDAKLFTTQELYGSYTSNLFCADTVTNPSAKTCYMSIGSTGGSTYQAPNASSNKRMFEVGVVPYPQAENRVKNAVIQQGPSLVLFKNDDPQKVLASWLFMKELLTPETMVAIAKNNGYIPSTKSAIDDPATTEWLNTASGYRDNMTAYGAKVAIQQQKSNSFYTSDAFLGSSTARDQVGMLLVNVMNGIDVDKAFKAAIKECERSIA